MCHESCGSEVDSDPETFTRLKWDLSVVTQDRTFPLFDFQCDVPLRMRLASESPSCREILRSEETLHIRGNVDLACNDAYPAAAAQRGTAAREFDSSFEKQIGQFSSGGHFNGAQLWHGSLMLLSVARHRPHILMRCPARNFTSCPHDVALSGGMVAV